MKALLSRYAPGIFLFLIALIIGCLTYQDYGVAWDEPLQRDPGVLSYEYAFNGKQDLFTMPNDYHGAAFELLLVVIEKKAHITSMRDIYLMRHLVTHIFFLLACFFGYVLIYRLFRNQLLACLGFIMLVFMPRIYAHSFFNSKDIPFLAMLIITLAVAQYAFEKGKAWHFLILGLVAGYMTSIRIMGIMPVGIIFFFLIFDLVQKKIQKERIAQNALNIFLFLIAFVFSVYITWPYLWRAPVTTFIESFKRLSHFAWEGEVFYNGKLERGDQLSWRYMPIWFGVTVPVIWSALGISGIIALIFDFFRKPLAFLTNTPARTFIIALACCIVPMMAVIVMHSVVYDDWRHLYFIYPPFILLGLYFLNKVQASKFKLAIYSLIGFQLGLIYHFMSNNHPFHQVYFNELVSRKNEYIRTHYDFDYWGVSFKQALEHLTATNKGVIKINTGNTGEMPLKNNISFFQDRDRYRIQFVDLKDADYYITDFRGHPENYDFPSVVFSRRVLGSTMVCVYRTK